MISCTWILLLWKDHLYLNPVVWKDHLYLDPVCERSSILRWCALSWILLCERITWTWIMLCERISCTWILLCQRISCTCILLCERSSILRWCNDWKAPGPMRSILLLERSISSSWLRPASVFSPRLRSRFRLRSRNLPANQRPSGSTCCGSGSGSISQRYGSGSFYNQAKIVRKTLIPMLFCDFFMAFYLWKIM